MTYITAVLLYLFLVNAVVCAAALWYWFRSKKVGFAWIAAAFGLILIMLFSIQFLAGLGGFLGPYLMWLPLSFPFFFLICMLIGLRFLFVQVSPDHAKADHQSETNPWVIIRRLAFSASGILLLLLGLSIIVRSMISLAQRQGVDPYLGVGPGALFVGLMCLWLAFHRRSPLRAPK